MHDSDITVHSLLALEIALEMTGASKAKANLYIDTLPKDADFAATTPLMWPAQLQKLLPRLARKIVTEQQTAINQNFREVSKKFPDLSKDVFIHSWLLVNTRTFNYEVAELQHLSTDGQIALVPIADLINHSEGGCAVTFSDTAYIITADRKYRQGEELQFCYGEQHSNDALLAEYGFILVPNKWDTVTLDEVILPRLNAKQRAELGGEDWLGRFTLNNWGEPSDRTRRAVWLISRGEDDPEDIDSDDEESFNTVLAEVLDTFAEIITKTLSKLAILENVGQASQRKILLRRWMQIQAIVAKARRDLEYMDYSSLM